MKKFNFLRWSWWNEPQNQPNESSANVRYAQEARIKSDLLAQENDRLYTKVKKLIAENESLKEQIKEYQNRFF